MERLELVKLIALRIKEEGGRAFFVGGYVRDFLLGKRSDDYDIEVYGLGVKNLYKILHEFGKLSSDGLRYGIFKLTDYDMDFALPRKEVKKGILHRDFDVICDPFLSYKEASTRRDFTINAILMDVLTGEIIDPFNGKNDIDDKVLRCVNEKQFVEDPLRVLRAYQLASRTCYKIDDATKRICNSLNIDSISKERFFIELNKSLLYSEKPSVFFSLLYELNCNSSFAKKTRCLEENIDDFFRLIDDSTKHRDCFNESGKFMSICLCLFSNDKFLNSIKQLQNEAENLVIYNGIFRGSFVESNSIQKAAEKISNTILNVLSEIVHNLSISKILNTLNESEYLKESVEILKIICESFSLKIDNLYIEKIYKSYKSFDGIQRISGDDLKQIGIKENKNFKEIISDANLMIFEGKTKQEVLKELQNEKKCL